MPELEVITKRACVPRHYVSFLAAVVLTAVTLVVQLLHGVTASAVAEQAVITLRVAATVAWVWHFTAYTVHTLGQRMDGAGTRITALEGRMTATEEVYARGYRDGFAAGEGLRSDRGGSTVRLMHNS